MLPVPSAAALAPKVSTMKTTSRPSRNTPLKASVKAYQSMPAAATAPADRETATRAENRFAQPLQPEDEQQGADEHTQRVDRDERQCRSERGDQTRKRDEGDDDPDERRTPLTADADGEHDGQG